MITPNVHLKDGLINDQFGIVYDFGYTHCSITKVHIKLYDEKAGKNVMLTHSYSLKHEVALIRNGESKY